MIVAKLLRLRVERALLATAASIVLACSQAAEPAEQSVTTDFPATSGALASTRAKRFGCPWVLEYHALQDQRSRCGRKNQCTDSQPPKASDGSLPNSGLKSSPVW